ncbi:MAG: DUF2207 domain-containing protein [Fusobacterium sp. JB020]|nr:DUF2207 domain-containing protein [Fusobacterium sp. JB020]
MLKWSFSLFFLMVSLAFGDGGYVINNYKVNLKVNEKNVYSIQEDIKVNFLESRRGIYRVIPTKFNGREIKLTNLKANEKATFRDKGSYVYLRLGDPNIYLTGIKDYKILYDYDLGWDRNSKYDEVYYNLIGNDWDTIIKSMSFNIELPKPFDPEKINFTLGKFGSVNTSGVVWTVDGLNIKGYTTRVLNPGESVTMALPLEEGYFNVGNAKTKYYMLILLMALVYISAPIISYIFYKKYSDKDEIIETVEFYPPEKMNPTEIGYYIDNRVDLKDITSLIIYWASKGYLIIEEIEKKNMFSKSSLKFIKLKEIETKNEYEKYLFNSLFTYSNDNNEVNINDLRDSFYTHINKAAKIFKIDLVMDKKTVYIPKILKLGEKLRVISIIAIAAVTLFFFNQYGQPEIEKSFVQIIAVLLSALTTLYFTGKIRKRTEFANGILGRILGFKRFLTVTEKAKLEALIKENPSYFYDILPYTIVLGVSDAWANKFNDLVTTPPNWYRSNTMGDTFVLYMFMSSLNHSMARVNQDMMSSPKAPSNFGGGMSSMGGGSAGGGAGGGGGGSW